MNRIVLSNKNNGKYYTRFISFYFAYEQLDLELEADENLPFCAHVSTAIVLSEEFFSLRIAQENFVNIHN